MTKSNAEELTKLYFTLTQDLTKSLHSNITTCLPDLIISEAALHQNFSFFVFLFAHREFFLHFLSLSCPLIFYYLWVFPFSVFAYCIFFILLFFPIEIFVFLHLFSIVEQMSLR